MLAFWPLSEHCFARQRSLNWSLALQTLRTQGLAAGLMLCISVMDLYPEAVEEVGMANASLWFYLGVAFFAFVVHYCPEPPASMIEVDVDDDDAGAGAQEPSGTAKKKGRVSKSAKKDSAEAPASPPPRQRVTRSMAKVSGDGDEASVRQRRSARR